MQVMIFFVHAACLVSVKCCNLKCVQEGLASTHVHAWAGVCANGANWVLSKVYIVAEAPVIAGQRLVGGHLLHIDIGCMGKTRLLAMIQSIVDLCLNSIVVKTVACTLLLISVAKY